MTGVEWEWVRESVSDYESLDALEAHAVYALGEKSGVIVKSVDQDDPENPVVWTYYSVYSQEREGFTGYEAIDGFSSLDEAKAFGDSMKAEILLVLRREDL